MGYATDEKIRANAASGGMVTALLCSLLRAGKIDGAWVTRSFVKNGELSYETIIATSEDEIKSCSSSIYIETPQMKHIRLLSEFSGQCAVVMLPCQMRAFNEFISSKMELCGKVVLRICLYCGGVCDKQSVIITLRKKGVALSEVQRVIFKRGHYKGKMVIQKTDGTEQHISYTKGFCAYKNAYFFSKTSCMLCQDFFGRHADLSFGDIWLKSMKKNPIKHTSCIIHNETGLAMYNTAIEMGDITDFHFTRRKLLLSNKRALTFKYNCAKSKVQYFEKQNKKLFLDTHAPCRWNHRLAYALARRNQIFSNKKADSLKKIPMWLIYCYMCFIRLLLNF
jgi:coenzyme F420-reducing hydrogenase beta subunit